jgi:transcriptional regulator with XRE-family HTH domain
MQTLTPKKGCSKEKIGEILRFQAFMRLKGLQEADISEKTGVSKRTIKNYIYDDEPMGGKLLRALHSNYSVSIDWLLTGQGKMFLEEHSKVTEERSGYSSDSNRVVRVIGMIKEWMSCATEDEQAWFETELKIKHKQLQALKED